MGPGIFQKGKSGERRESHGQSDKRKDTEHKCFCLQFFLCSLMLRVTGACVCPWDTVIMYTLYRVCPSHTYRHLTLHFCETLYQMDRQTCSVESLLKGLLTHASGMDSSTRRSYTVIHPQPVNHNAYVKHNFQKRFLYNCNKCPRWLNRTLMDKTR